MEICVTPANRIQPTQLYISQIKLERAEQHLQKHGYEDYAPIPVKKIGEKLLFVDGHSRALLLYKAGHEVLRTSNEPGDWDWRSYLANVRWCRDAGINTIADLESRVVDHHRYRRLWIRRCDRLHKAIERKSQRNLAARLESDRDRKALICKNILDSLPQWFGIEEAKANYIEASRDLDFLVLSLFGVSIGFCALKYHYEKTCELYVLGIAPEFHGMGFGIFFFNEIFRYCRSKGMEFVTVKTLSERHPDRNYRKTREFYLKMGFTPLEELPELWDERNPCLFMVRDLKLRK